MIDPKFFENIAKRLSDAVPKPVRDMEKDLQKKFHAILQSAFSKLDLVTREEFDAQVKVLARTRQKVDALVKTLEQADKQKPPVTKRKPKDN